MRQLKMLPKVLTFISVTTAIVVGIVTLFSRNKTNTGLLSLSEHHCEQNTAKSNIEAQRPTLAEFLEKVMYTDTSKPRIILGDPRSDCGQKIVILEPETQTLKLITYNITHILGRAYNPDVEPFEPRVYWAACRLKEERKTTSITPCYCVSKTLNKAKELKVKAIQEEARCLSHKTKKHGKKQHNLKKVTDEKLSNLFVITTEKYSGPLSSPLSDEAKPAVYFTAYTPKKNVKRCEHNREQTIEATAQEVTGRWYTEGDCFESKKSLLK